jgi:hypothetical protein
MVVVPSPPLPRARIEVNQIVEAARVKNNMLRVHSLWLDEYGNQVRDAFEKMLYKLKRAHSVIIAG